VSLAKQIKPISYVKAHAADLVRDMHKSGEPIIITQNGEAKAVLQDIESYERTQETLALLKIVALGEKQYREGKAKPAAEVFRRLRAKHGLD
jgi:prevent-host-death family protein